MDHTKLLPSLSMDHNTACLTVLLLVTCPIPFCRM